VFAGGYAGRLWDANPAGDSERHIFEAIYSDDDNLIM
jgi:hypothetical protein